ncbi:DUF397 domain-containing protein [Sphaerisporangium sp. NPDC049002]|uniref:DUF397 domain-containing protein n=1 Tax=Sphaerisporangium sp. NPDC049002 TaxID=3155392 RepID=UPI0033DA42CB
MELENGTAQDFRRSSFCNPDGGCVEVARGTRGAAVRDAKNPAGAVLVFTEEEWTAFVRGVRAGEFD